MDDEDVQVFIYSFNFQPIDESALMEYFGEANLGTGYLFLYTASDYTSDNLLKQMMPDNWKPPVHAPRFSNSSVDAESREEVDGNANPPILATQELIDDEIGDLPNQSDTLAELSNNTSASAATSNQAQVANGNSHRPHSVDTKRPSLSALYVPTFLSPGPSSNSFAGSSNDPSNQKEGGWGWFKKGEKKK
jgi:hypothetical protein